MQHTALRARSTTVGAVKSQAQLPLRCRWPTPASGPCTSRGRWTSLSCARIGVRSTVCRPPCSIAVPTESPDQTAPARGGPDSNAAVEAADAAEDDGKLMVTFRYPAALEGNEVGVIGSFDGWREVIPLRRSPETQDFVRSVAVAPGTYQYKYIVDGQWTTSPCDAIARDSEGQLNHQRLISPSVDFAWHARWAGSAQEVFVTGDFAGWAELLPLRKDPRTGDFRLPCSLPPGMYYIQFLVDGSWMTSPDLPVGPDEDNHFCNKIFVPSPPAFHIYYATGWDVATLRYRVLSDGKPYHQDWLELPMTETASRAAPAGGAWRAAVVPLPPELAHAAVQSARATASDEARTRAPRESSSPVHLEFVITDGGGKEDRPQGAAAYTCASVGGFKLAAGRLTPFPNARHPPSMLVSDLDGTMVGDGPEADAATAEFRDYWEANAALCGSVLVYNTGRSLGQFISLLEEKQGALALPDVLITAVGTKIFLLDCASRGSASTAGWREDLQWAQRLNEGWDLGAAKQVVEEVLRGLLGDGAGAWLDQGTEHPHRLALSVRLDRLPDARRRLADGFAGRGLQVRIIVSGVGSWRYVDCVSIRAGKLEALEYVRMLYGIALDRCVAAGDSGNDILMLEGRNLAVCVGNSQPALLDWLMQQPQSPRAICTDAHMARGVLEGFSRHGLY